jgi:LmbE family N-acetylglucosaminyl deacetylase
MNKRILVVAAHPDDETLGCGGAVIKHVKAGDDVKIITIGDGVTSRDYRPGADRKKELADHKKEIDLRRERFIKAAQILGVRNENCSMLDLPDQRLDGSPILDIIKNIEELTAKDLPNIVYTHHFGDLNRDHRIVCEAVMTAFRPRRGEASKVSIFGFEISGNMDYMLPVSVYGFKPDHFIDISGVIEQKLRALAEYQDDLWEYPSPLSAKAVEELAQRRGKDKGYKYAEAFCILKQEGTL